jgi:hypothetical protein
VQPDFAVRASAACSRPRKNALPSAWPIDSSAAHLPRMQKKPAIGGEGLALWGEWSMFVHSGAMRQLSELRDRQTRPAEPKLVAT